MNPLKLRRQRDLTEHVQSRMDFLFDGVVAIAITMMALEISVPVTSVFGGAELAVLLEELTVYLVSFLALASVWSIHNTLVPGVSKVGLPYYVLNVALMFAITVFPVLTKLMTLTERNGLLCGAYLVGYGVMECLLLVEYVLSRRGVRPDVETQMDKVRDVLEIQHAVRTDESQEQRDLEKKLELTQQYLSEPEVSEQLFRELLLKMPQSFQERYEMQAIAQTMRNCKTLAFSIVTFLAVVACVMVLIVNPFWCYAVLLLACACYGVVHILISSHFQKKGVSSCDLNI